MYVPIVEPTLTGPRIMPPWQTLILHYMVRYLFSTSVVAYTSLAPPMDFLLGNSGSLLDFHGYRANA
jgi:quinol-cytochrome oxidoreductase complex cytochrome b subunit